jgi:hypothetical protein
MDEANKHNINPADQSKPGDKLDDDPADQDESGDNLGDNPDVNDNKSTYVLGRLCNHLDSTSLAQQMERAWCGILNQRWGPPRMT